MLTSKKQFKTIDEYIKAFPDDVQRILVKMRETIRNAAPGAVEATAPWYILRRSKITLDFIRHPQASKNLKKNYSRIKEEKARYNSL